MFGRASADDKAPIMMFLTAIDGLKKNGEEPQVNVKVMLDSEEEKGSPSIRRSEGPAGPAALRRHRHPRRPEARHRPPDTHFRQPGRGDGPLTVYGAKVALHSGHFGNYAPNPAQRWRLLASMKDDEGRVTVPATTTA